MKTFMSIDNTANAIGIAKTTLRQWVWDNKIPYIKVGCKYMIDVPKTLKMLRNGEVQ